MACMKEKEKKERAMAVGRRTREETAQWNQMTSLIFQTGGWGGGVEKSNGNRTADRKQGNNQAKLE